VANSLPLYQPAESLTLQGFPNQLRHDSRWQTLEEGPIPAIHGVVRWRECDLIMRLYEEFGLSVSDDTIYRVHVESAAQNWPPGVSLVRLSRCREHAIGSPSVALRQLRLQSLRLSFHAHPPQLANQSDKFVRLLPWRPVRRLLLFKRPFHVLFLVVSRIIECSFALERHSTSATQSGELESDS
jgi:hypothetical protein